MTIKLLSKMAVITAFTLFVKQNEVQAQNLIDMQGWVIGQGSSGMFGQNGQDSENAREWGIGPHGKPVILWKAKPDGNTDADGGWNSGTISINHTNMYRFSVWLKKTNSTQGNSFFGCQNVLNLNGTSNDNPYFWYGNLPELNKWYLLIGYVHGSGDASTINYGGIYDGISGAKVVDMTDFKFAITANSTHHRSYLYYDPNVNDEQFFYAPRVEVVNGNEPTIAALLGLQNGSADLAYFSGKVGIKTPDPGNYDLAVKGKIRTQEVKVETANWPDFVFAEDYKPKSLNEIEKFIKLNKHLPDIAPAKEIERNGFEIGEMNKMLLQKIEELTLHLIEKDKEIKSIKNDYQELRKMIIESKPKKN